MADQVLYSGVACITDLMVKEGLINLDFADVRSIMSEMGKAMMGTGEATGERRAVQAAEAAIANPLLDEVSMKGARGLLISITGGNDLTLYEVDEAASRIRQEVDEEANIILGATFDSSLDGVVRVSVVATGIDQEAIERDRARCGRAAHRNDGLSPRRRLARHARRSQASRSRTKSPLRSRARYSRRTSPRARSSSGRSRKSPLSMPNPRQRLMRSRRRRNSCPRRRSSPICARPACRKSTNCRSSRRRSFAPSAATPLRRRRRRRPADARCWKSSRLSASAEPRTISRRRLRAWRSRRPRPSRIAPPCMRNTPARRRVRRFRAPPPTGSWTRKAASLRARLLRTTTSLKFRRSFAAKPVPDSRRKPGAPAPDSRRKREIPAPADGPGQSFSSPPRAA